MTSLRSFHSEESSLSEELATLEQWCVVSIHAIPCLAAVVCIVTYRCFQGAMIVTLDQEVYYQVPDLTDQGSRPDVGLSTVQCSQIRLDPQGRI